MFVFLTILVFCSFLYGPPEIRLPGLFVWACFGIIQLAAHVAKYEKD